MAKIKGPLLSTRASGRFAGVLSFRDTARGPVATRYHYPGSRNLVTPSQVQLDHRALYGALVADWRALTQPQRDQWDADAPPGQSGWNLYVRNNIGVAPVYVSVLDVGARITDINTSSLSGSYTLPSGGSNRILVVALTTEDNATDDATAMTYNGVALTKGPNTIQGGGYSNRAQLWYLLDPSLPAPGAYTLVVTMSASCQSVYMLPLLIQDAVQGAPTAQVGVSTSNIVSADITPPENALIIEAVVSNNLGSMTPDSTQTEHDEFLGGVSDFVSAVGSRAITTSQAYSEQWACSDVSTVRMALALAAWGSA